MDIPLVKKRWEGLITGVPTENLFGHSVFAERALVQDHLGIHDGSVSICDDEAC